MPELTRNDLDRLPWGASNEKLERVADGLMRLADAQLRLWRLVEAARSVSDAAALWACIPPVTVDFALDAQLGRVTAMIASDQWADALDVLGPIRDADHDARARPAESMVAVDLTEGSGPGAAYALAASLIQEAGPRPAKLERLLVVRALMVQVWAARGLGDRRLADRTLALAIERAASDPGDEFEIELVDALAHRAAFLEADGETAHAIAAYEEILRHWRPGAAAEPSPGGRVDPLVTQTNEQKRSEIIRRCHRRHRQLLTTGSLNVSVGHQRPRVSVSH